MSDIIGISPSRIENLGKWVEAFNGKLEEYEKACEELNAKVASNKNLDKEERVSCDEDWERIDRLHAELAQSVQAIEVLLR